jgi:hypothetical protein
MACTRCGQKATIRPAGSRAGSNPTTANGKSSSSTSKPGNPYSVITGLKYVPK